MGARKRATEIDGDTEWHLRELARNTSSRHENQHNIMVFYSNKLRPPVAREENRLLPNPARPPVRRRLILCGWGSISSYLISIDISIYICISRNGSMDLCTLYLYLTKLDCFALCTSSYVFDLHVILVSYLTVFSFCIWHRQGVINCVGF